MSRDKRTKRSSYRQLFEFGLIAVAIVVLVFIVTYAIQINKGIAKEIVGPEYHLRLEILNAGSENGLENKLQEYLQNLELPDMELNIVKISRFTLQPSKESFIISRTEDLKGIKELAKLLHIENEKIQYSKLRSNKNHLNATIVIGTDLVINNLLENFKELE